MYVTLSNEPALAPTSAQSSTARRPFASASRSRKLPASAYLYREQDEAEHVYEVKSGVLRLTRVLENGRRQVIAFGLPGDIIGFPNGTRHNTDCDVVTTSEVVAHRRSDLETGECDPETHERLMQAAMREISAMQDHFMMLAHKSALEKVASFLIVLARRTGRHIDVYTTFSLPMSRADIADFLGLTIETVSRMFSQLRKCGTISLNTPQDVVVLDMPALIDASQAD